MTIETIYGLGTERSYLIKEDSDYILVDCGWHSTAEKVLRQTRDIGIIVATHRHYDHIGSIEFLKSQTGAIVAAGAVDYAGGEIRIIQALPHAFDSWVRKPYFPSLRDLVSMKFSLARVDRLLRDRDSIGGRGEWRVVDSPGHTTDSICLYHEKEGVLITGDTMVNSLNRPPRWGKIIFNFGKYEETKNKLSRLEIKTVYPGHGEPFIMTETIRETLFNAA